MNYFEQQSLQRETDVDNALLTGSKKVKKPASSNPEGQLTVDVYQTEDEIVVQSTIAGVTTEDIDISVTTDMLTIKGTRQPEEKIRASDYYYRELYWGAFSRTIILPEDVDADKTKAILKNGILTVRMPKAAKSRFKKIKVSD